jgi:oligoribonuclease NrnB/cAMP/cGMP phosphodiesterase (DHH superfamily)
MNEQSMKGTDVVCFYHNDPDGRCSAAIVRRAFKGVVTCLPMDYGDEIDWRLIEDASEVIVVDFSFPLPIMERINLSSNLIWIDHHVTAIEELDKLKEIRGIRDLNLAGCVLTWKYFFPDIQVPKAVLYVGDRDIWKNEYPETKPFGEGLYQENTMPENDAVWGPLLEDDQTTIKALIQQGEILYAARRKRYARALDSRGVEVEFESHRTMLINEVGNGDLGEMIREQGYEIGYCYFERVQNGILRTFVTLYSDTVDVSAIAKKFGGGGHRGAAGFSFSRGTSPFPSEAHFELVG